jgi:hypothetical protein
MNELLVGLGCFVMAAFCLTAAFLLILLPSRGETNDNEGPIQVKPSKQPAGPQLGLTSQISKGVEQ